MVDQVIKNTFAETYRDDHSDSAGFHRILFNNGRAVQARELTQLQTITQREMTRFGDNIFKEGAVVHSGGFGTNNSEFIKLDETANELPTDTSGLLETTFTGSTSGVKAIVTHTVAATASDPATIYFRYTNSNGSNRLFEAGENITSGATTLTIQTTNTTANPAFGRGIFLTGNEGVYYATGRFVFSPKQTVLVSKYTTTISDDFGFLTTESIVTANDDSTLYDNSGALPNTSAPGADRYKIALTLTLRSLVDSDESFVYVGRIDDDGRLSDINKPANEENYNVIREMLATRTSEESGDYIVKPFILNFSNNIADESKLDIRIQPGTAYVDGYRIAKTESTLITINKPRTTTTVSNEVTAATLGNYVLVDGTTSKGLPNIQDFTQVNLRSAVTHGGSTIGTARVRAVDEDNSGNYRLHLFQISMNSGQNFRSVRSIGTSTTDYFNLVLELGQAVLKDPKTNSLLYPLPKVRPSNLTDISLATQRRFTASVTAGSASLTLSATGETFSNTNDWIISADDGVVVTGATVSGAGTTSSTISGLGGVSNVEVLTYINKASGSVRSKTLVQDQEDTIATGDWDSDSNGTIFAYLTKPDVFNFTSVTRDTVSGNSVRSRFILDNGQRDNYYGLGRLVLRSGQSVPTYDVVAKYDHFTHSVSGDFFAVNSYTGQVDYPDIQAHVLANGNTIQLRNVLDFRPVVNSSGTFGSGARINELPQPNDTVQVDASYYNYQYIKIIADTKSNLRVMLGEESLTPKYPLTPDNALDLYRIVLNPYVLDPKDLVAKQIESKHYTMADIGRLEKKVDDLAESTSLSLLELDTANFQVLDSDGNNRSKSGFFVDNFANHFFSDITDPNYAAAIDPVFKLARPQYVTNGINLMYDSDHTGNQDVVKKGDNIYLRFTERTFLNQNQASGTENVTPFWHIRFNGHITLSPASDNWIEQAYEPNAVVNQTQLDTSGATLWNSHEWNWGGTAIEDLAVGSSTNSITLSTNSSSSNSNVQRRNGGADITQTTVTNTTTGQNRVVGETTITSVIGDRLIQAVSIPFMRSRKIYFQGIGFRPDTEVFPFFDGIDVSDWCKDEAFVRTSDNAETAGNAQNGALGHPEGSSQLIADANGTVEGSFFIPSTANLKFPTGTKLFQLIDVTDPANEDGSTSYGKQTFTSAGILQRRQRDVLNTRTLEINTITSTSSSSSTRVIGRINPPQPQQFSCFVAGTLVTMADGSKKKIEDVELGEELLGQDGIINTVLEFDHPPLDGRDLIAFNGGKPLMTPEHPLWTKEGWKSYSAETTQWQKPEIAHLMINGDFVVGDEILMDDDTWFTIESIDVHPEEPEQQVYNFYLDGNNTYYADGFLAHNRGPSPSPDPAPDPGPDPLAQSFRVTEANGTFITKADIYFATKDPGTAPVWLQIRGIDNGYPASEIIGGSTVYKFPSEITTSDDGSVATTFEFAEPVYLSPAKEYCIVVLSNVPTYNIYISKVGDFVLGTTDTKITKQPFLGSLFKSQNNSTWTATQWEDMKVHIHSAKFSLNQGVAELTNTDVPLQLLTEDPLSVDSADATITVHQPSHGFTVGDTVNIANSTDFAGISASSINGARTITVVDATGYQFEADSASTSAELGGGAAITADQNILMDRMNVNLATLIPTGTAIQSSVKTITGQSIAGTETAYQIQSDYKSIVLGKNIDFDAPQMIANAANETAQIAGAKSFKLKATMFTNDENVSPVIDMQRATVLAVSNTIDKPAASPGAGFNVPINYVAETDPKGGSSVAKHISSPITLAESAVGMTIFIAANKPSAASFDVYYRVASGDDNISDISWTIVTPETALISDDNPDIFREYAYLVGGNTGTLDAFNQMQIKIVMVSENSSKVPILRDIRSIALAT
jgi:hypothetical protein